MAELVDKPSRKNEVLAFAGYFVARYPDVFREHLQFCRAIASWTLLWLARLCLFGCFLAAVLPLSCSALIATCRRGAIYVRNRSTRGSDAQPISSSPTQAV